MNDILKFFKKILINKKSQKHLNRKKNKVTSRLTFHLKFFFLRNKKIKFPLFNDPEISVVLVLYNQAQFTLGCLRLVHQQINVPYEVIIIDNASNDSTHQLLDYCCNTLIVKNPENVGFLQAANQGAQMARGRNLLFLNNDIWQLNKNAFDRALQTLNSDPTIGVVGAKVILPNGLLQEAGVCITQKDIYQYGRAKEPDVFEVNFQRHVDYCSGIFLLTRKDLFQSLGGFDVLYAPAYWEDSDYCLRVNRAGFKVIYEPRIIVGHIEGGSAIKKEYVHSLHEKNILLFHKKHEAWLQTLTHLSDFSSFTSRCVLISRYHNRDCKRLLFIGNGIPNQTTRNRMQSACDLGHAVSYYPLNKLALSWNTIYSFIDIRVEVCNSLRSLDDFINIRKNYYNQIIDENGNDEKWLKYFPFIAVETVGELIDAHTQK